MTTRMNPYTALSPLSLAAIPGSYISRHVIEDLVTTLNAPTSNQQQRTSEIVPGQRTPIVTRSPSPRSPLMPLPKRLVVASLTPLQLGTHDARSQNQSSLPENSPPNQPSAFVTSRTRSWLPLPVNSASPSPASLASPARSPSRSPTSHDLVRELQAALKEAQATIAEFRELQRTRSPRLSAPRSSSSG